MRLKARLPPRVRRRTSPLPLALPCQPRVAHRTQGWCPSLAQAQTPPYHEPRLRGGSRERGCTRLGGAGPKPIPGEGKGQLRRGAG